MEPWWSFVRQWQLEGQAQTLTSLLVH
jgi:hypothetical protein